MSSRDRRRIPIPFGGGLDREKGAMIAPATSMSDLRNVLLHQGKYLVRRGFEHTITLTNDLGETMTDVLGGQALRSTRSAIYVGYHAPTGKVEVFRGDSFGQAATFIGTWFTLPADTAPPIVSMAEARGRVFLAHDATIGSRAQTYYYDAATDGIVPFVEELVVGNGDEAVHFRGVVRHDEYLFGWGFGTLAEDRPEFVRVSQPAEPTVFSPNHYFQIGDRNDPVVRCIPAGGTLLAFKETETYEIFGFSRDTFGERILDPLYGMQVSRLAVNVGGLTYAWTGEGPRLYDGTWGSQSLELPLELPQPEPADLVAEGELRYAFAEYLPNFRVVLFVFGQRVYALTIREGDEWKWSYWELGFTAMCGFRLPATGSGLLDPPTGHADTLSVVASVSDALTIQWSNNGQDGDEYLETWVKQTGGLWTQNETFIVTLDATQQGQLTGLQPGLDTEIAVRYRRGPFYGDGYTSDDPDDWPASAKVTGQTTLDGPTIDSATWLRVDASTERVDLTVTPVHAGVDVEILRGGVVIGTQSAPAGQFTFQDTGVVGEANNSYTVRHVTSDRTGVQSGATVVWGGPAPAPSGLSASAGGAEAYNAIWTNGRSDLSTEVHDSWDGFGVGAFPQRLVTTVGPGGSFQTGLSASGASGQTLTVGVRHKQTTDGVDDYSDFSPTDTVLVS